MIVLGMTDSYLCADGKFFVIFDHTEDGKARYRQIERYLPAAPGTYNEELGVTMQRWLNALEDGTADWKWAIGSSGSQLTARYQIRESDGELVSELALSGGIKA